jgi:hypothetical protein
MAKKKILVEPNGQAKFFEMPNPFDLELWDAYGDYLADHRRELDKEQDRFAEQFEEKCGWFNWDVGDWLLEGEDGGVPGKELKRWAESKFAKHRRRSWKTMKNWKVTARAFRQVDGEPSRRRDGREGRAAISYSNHQLVEQFPPATQDLLLDVALDRNFGHDGLKEYIKDLRESGQLLPAKDKPIVIDDAKYTTINVRLRKAHCAFLKAVRPAGTAGLTAADIIQEYIEANLDALVARAVKHEARWGTVPRDVLANRAEKWQRVNWPEPLPGFTPMPKSSEPQK